MSVSPRPTSFHGESSTIQRMLSHSLLPTLLCIVSLLASPATAIPIEDPQCPQFCFCSDNFVSCTDFSFLDLSMIPQSADTLVLSNGEVEEIPPAFLATAPNLQILEINSVYTRVLRGHAFIGLNRLQLLTITGSTFDIVEPDSFSNISEIVKFEIVDSKFGRLGKHAFGYITNVAEFNIWSNTFEEFTAEAFVGLKNIDRFQLIRNNISQIGHDLFKDAHGVSKITVYQNRIGAVDPGSMERLAQISTRMVFRANIFRCTCDLAWMLDQPDLVEYMSANECSFTKIGQKPNPDNTFKLSDINRDVLCVARENEMDKSLEVGDAILPEDTQSLQYAYVPYFDEDIDIMGEEEEVQLEEKTIHGDNKLVKFENAGSIASSSPLMEGIKEESTEGITEESTERITEESTEGIKEESTEGITEESTEGIKEESTEGITEESTEGIKEHGNQAQEIMKEGNIREQDGGQEQIFDPSISTAMTPKESGWTLMKINQATIYGTVREADLTNTENPDEEPQFTTEVEISEGTEGVPKMRLREHTLHSSVTADATGRQSTLSAKKADKEVKISDTIDHSFEQFTVKASEAATSSDFLHSSSSTAEEDGQPNVIMPVEETFEVDISEISNFHSDSLQSEQSQGIKEVFELPSTRTAPTAKPAVNDLVTMPDEWFTEAERLKDGENRKRQQSLDTQLWDMGLHMKPERLNSEVERDSASIPVPPLFLLILSVITILVVRS